MCYFCKTMSQLPVENQELVERLRNPETVTDAFAEVIKSYSEPLYWQIRKMVQTHDDADDVLQNTFMKAWQNLENFRGEARLSTWLYKIAINESLSHLEREKRRAGVSLDDDEAYQASLIESDEYIDGDQLSLDLRKAVASLPEKQRLVFNMKYYDDMKFEDISNILGTSVGALKASYHLAVKKIENFFKNL